MMAWNGGCAKVASGMNFVRTAFVPTSYITAFAIDLVCQFITDAAGMEMCSRDTAVTETD